jgi:hypothetical protein
MDCGAFWIFVALGCFDCNLPVFGMGILYGYTKAERAPFLKQRSFCKIFNNVPNTPSP